MEELKQLRDVIDGIDGTLLDLLNERARLAQEIGGIKKRTGLPIYAPERAEQLVRRLAERSKGPLGTEAIRAIYREIMSASLSLEKDMVIACLGCSADRTHFAARQQFGSSVRYSFHATPAALVAAVASEAADCGVIPFGEEGPEMAILELLMDGKAFFSSQIVLDGGEKDILSRYLVLGRILNAPSGDDQTALLLRHAQSVALGPVMEAFRGAGLNVLSVQSHPVSGGGLHLFLETEGHADGEPLRHALEKLRQAGFSNLVCGSYPRFH